MKKIYLLLTILLISSCGLTQGGYDKKIKSNNSYVENDNVSVQLAIAAKKASNALVELAEIEKVITPTTTAPILEDVPRLLRQKMSITWNGPIGPLAKKISDRAMYQFIEVGNKPSIPVLVQVDAIETPLVDILKNIGLQAGARANVVVDIENRNIEVHYVETQETL